MNKFESKTNEAIDSMQESFDEIIKPENRKKTIVIGIISVVIGLTLAGLTLYGIYTSIL